jgi:hypothetical protein
VNKQLDVANCLRLLLQTLLAFLRKAQAQATNSSSVADEQF